MNPRDDQDLALPEIIGDAIRESIWVFTNDDRPIGLDDVGLMGDIDRALTAHGYVIVAKPTDRDGVFVRWDTTPCPDCDGVGGTSGVIPYEVARWKTSCRACGGSGVVEAVTMWGLEAVGRYFDGEPDAPLDEPLFKLTSCEGAK